MKKIIFALLAVLFFAGCKKNEAPALNGTEWRYSENHYTLELSFAETQFTLTMTTSDGEITTSSGTYTYDHPKVLFDLPEDHFILSRNGLVEGDTMLVEIVVGDLGHPFRFHRIN